VHRTEAKTTPKLHLMSDSVLILKCGRPVAYNTLLIKWQHWKHRCQMLPYPVCLSMTLVHPTETVGPNETSSGGQSCSHYRFY